MLKTALISVPEKEDVLMPRVSVWLAGQVTAVKSVRNAANCKYHSQSEDRITCRCGHWPILRSLGRVPRLFENRFISPKLWSPNPKGVVLFHNTAFSYTKRNVKSVINIFFFYSGNCTDCSTEHGKCVKGFCDCEDGWEGATCEQKGEIYITNNNWLITLLSY